MKKLSFIFALVLAGSMAMAQNSATVSSTGSFEEATILQGIANNNTGLIIQTAPGGISNAPDEKTVAIIEQVSANLGSINQAGTRQVATIFQSYANVSTVVQTGSWNGSTNYLGGDQNFSQVAQHGKQNTGNIRSTSDYNGTALNPLNIYQVGDQNLAEIYSGFNKNSNGNLASIVQTGNENKSVLRQEGGDYNSAVITQYTSSNVANLNQTGSYLIATIDQYGGDDNIVNLDQTGGNVNIDQNGTANIVRGLQTPSAVVFGSFAGSTLDVMQIGTGNTLDLQSTSLGATVNVYQDGLTNAALVRQD